MHFIGMDIHKNYSSVAVTNERGDLVDRCRVNHRHREELIGYFNQFPSRTQVVMEATCGKRKGDGIPSFESTDLLVYGRN
jgi:hypothetical protein